MNTLTPLLKHLCLAALLVASASHAQQSAASETHAFAVRAEVQYRCFGGYPPKQRDSRTQVLCDNKTYHQVLVNERVDLRIQQEPSPDPLPSLAGSISRTREFRGRNFALSMSLFKDIEPGKPARYRLHAEADDDEPGRHRQSRVALQAASVKAFSPLQIGYDSVGQPEEIQYLVTIEPAP